MNEETTARQETILPFRGTMHTMEDGYDALLGLIERYRNTSYRVAEYPQQIERDRRRFMRHGEKPKWAVYGVVAVLILLATWGAFSGAWVIMNIVRNEARECSEWPQQEG